MACVNERALRRYGLSDAFELQSGIQIPTIQGNNFQMKYCLFSVLRQIQFGGETHKDPRAHLRKYVHLMCAMNQTRAPQEPLLMRFFHFTLTEKALNWLEELPPNSITTWSEVTKAFMGRFYSLEKTTDICSELVFRQEPNENLSEAWERFWGYIRECVHPMA
ncbi:unnamed protein product [Amaranthus hypochondriacus]